MMRLAATSAPGGSRETLTMAPFKLLGGTRCKRGFCLTAMSTPGLLVNAGMAQRRRRERRRDHKGPDLRRRSTATAGWGGQ
jgi:hypothetical protein